MGKQSDSDNHANQLNPNNDAYWESRGLEDRPDDWEEHADQDKSESKDKPDVEKSTRR